MKGRLFWDPDAIRQWAQARAARRRCWTRAEIERHTRRSWAELEQTPSWAEFPQPSHAGTLWVRSEVRDWWQAHLDRRDGRWDSQDVATELRLSWETVRTYRRRRILPCPDGIDANHPWWWPETILNWDRQRRTARGGRPRNGQPHSRQWRDQQE